MAKQHYEAEHGVEGIWLCGIPGCDFRADCPKLESQATGEGEDTVRDMWHNSKCVGYLEPYEGSRGCHLRLRALRSALWKRLRLEVSMQLLSLKLDTNASTRIQGTHFKTPRTGGSRQVRGSSSREELQVRSGARSVRCLRQECGESESASDSVTPGDLFAQNVQGSPEKTHQETERQAALGGAPEQAAEGPGSGRKTARPFSRGG